MANFGILKTSTNTGSNDELLAILSTPLTVRSNKPVLMNETVTLRRLSSYSEIQRWELECSMMPVADASELLVNTVVAGYTTAFWVRFPQIYRKSTSLGNYAITVASGSVAGTESVLLSSLAFKLPVGEFIQFSGHTKLYLIKATVTNANSTVSVTVFPKLVKPITAGETILFDEKLKVPMYFGDDVQIGVTYSDGILSSIDKITLVEAL